MVSELNGQGLSIRHTYCNLNIKIEIFKMTALCDNLVYDSDIWSTY